MDINAQFYERCISKLEKAFELSALAEAIKSVKSD
jgi:hypothetical protein